MIYDVAIIGAGVSGASIARELSKYNINVILLEKGLDVAMGSSKANSAIVHAGYDCKPGTLMAKLNIEGTAMMTKLCSDLKVSYSNCGSLVVAFDEDGLKVLDKLYQNGIKNGVKQMRIVDKDEAKKIEKNLSDKVVGALYAKTAGICSPYELTIALVENAILNGTILRYNYPVTDISKENDIFKIYSNDKVISSRYIVNAAGIYVDEISRLAEAEDYNILPRKGEYILLDKKTKPNVSTVIFQTPSKMGKGVLVAPTVHGNMFAGPTAFDTVDKEDNTTTLDGLNEIKVKSLLSVPDLDFSTAITQFAGIRSVLDGKKDFMICASKKNKNFIHCAGICSPGLSSAPAFGPYVRDILIDIGLTLEEKPNFIKTLKKKKLFNEMTKDELKEAYKDNKDFGKIICRCEKVSQAEIVNAIHSPVPALSVDAIKRRTRATAGRCQGGFCGPRIIEILSRELGTEEKYIVKSDNKSWIVKGSLRNGGDV